MKGLTLLGFGVALQLAAPVELGPAPAGGLSMAQAGPDRVPLFLQPTPGPHREPRPVSRTEGSRSIHGVKLGETGTAIWFGAGTTEWPNKVAGLGPGPADMAWIVKTEHFAIPWPAGTAVRTTQEGTDWPLETKLADHPTAGMIVVRGPYPTARIPPPKAMVGEGQTVTADHTTELLPWFDATYTVDGKPWVQRQVVRMEGGMGLLITAQAERAHFDALAEAAMTIARGATWQP